MTKAKNVSEALNRLNTAKNANQRSYWRRRINELSMDSESELEAMMDFTAKYQEKLRNEGFKNE